jgi:cob(I)alamin adenosyltransferase
MKYGELNSLKNLSNFITIKQYGRRCFIKDEPEDEDINCAVSGFEELTGVIVSGEYDIVILDEINIALYFNLLTIEDVMSLIELKPDVLELVFTGRKADQRIIDRADLVTEMREIKHYFKKGILSRKGIEC